MISTWRRRMAARRSGKDRRRPQEEDEGEAMELTVPKHFLCPISLDLMKDPVTLSTGMTYDRGSIEKWIEAGKSTCPVTNTELRIVDPIPNHAIRRMIQDWCVENKSYGIERIPTPRVPISPAAISEIMGKIDVAVRSNDAAILHDVVTKVKTLAKETEMNRKRIAAAGMARVLAEAFAAFSKGSFEEKDAVLEEVLTILTMISPMDMESKVLLSSTSCLRCLIWFLKSGDLSRRRNAVFVLKEIAVSADRRIVDELAEIDGAATALFSLINEPISPTATKSSLTIIYRIIEKQRNVEKFVKIGIVPVLLETLIGTERSASEKALGVLARICECDQGRAESRGNALCLPVLVKKILRVSDVATEFSVSILWRMICREEDTAAAAAAVESLQVGAFQKLLLLLQVGCSHGIKEKATELLKVLNVHRGKLECVDSLDFKQLKRPF